MFSMTCRLAQQGPSARTALLNNSRTLTTLINNNTIKTNNNNNNLIVNRNMSMFGAESNHWKAERVMTVASLALLPVAAATGPAMAVDMTMAAVFSIHSHWGMEQIIIDYAEKLTPTAKGPLLAMMKVITLGTFGGLVMFNMNDVGITSAVGTLLTL